MKIVDKGWAVWCGSLCLTAPFSTKESAEQEMGYLAEERSHEGYRVLRTTATATVAKKKARKK